MVLAISFGITITIEYMYLYNFSIKLVPIIMIMIVQELCKMNILYNDIARRGCATTSTVTSKKNNNLNFLYD